MAAGGGRGIRRPRDNGRVTSPLALPGWRHVYSGKVRDLYVPADARPTGGQTRGAERMLVVASDRVSAFDHVLEPGIPGKGVLLTTLSLWWFDQLAGGDGGRGIPNHLAARPHARRDGEAHRRRLIPDPEVTGRAMVVKSLDMQPIECVVRGYLTGSGWAEYRESGTVCGIRLPAGLENGDRLPAPIYTPGVQGADGRARREHLVRAHRRARRRRRAPTSCATCRSRSTSARRATAEARGLILADTKFEFGLDDDGVMTLADEVLTSDSSRYWDAAAWASGTTPAERMASFDKQIVRDWLAANWDKHGHAAGAARRDRRAHRRPLPRAARAPHRR